MLEKKKLHKDELKRLLIEHSILEGIKLGRYTEVIEDDSPARSIQNGRSLILSYYQARQYICTKHELRTRNGDIVHQDVETVVIGRVRYDRL